MRVNGVYLHPQDTVVTVTEAVDPGDVVVYQDGSAYRELIAAGSVPKFHKMAVASRKKGEVVLKYGERIGTALQDFAPGEHVHTHNLDSREGGK